MIPAYNAAYPIAKVVSKTKGVVDVVVVFDDCSTGDIVYVAENVAQES